MAQLELGAIAAETLDYAGAAGAYAAAEAAATAPGDKLGAQLSLIHVQTFLDPAAARATMGGSTPWRRRPSWPRTRAG